MFYLYDTKPKIITEAEICFFFNGANANKSNGKISFK